MPKPRRQAPSTPDDELAGPPPKRGRCTAKTAKGARCKSLALPGVDKCATHLGKPYAKPGRPAKLSADVVDQVVEILRFGGYAETAIAAAGISKRTFQRWLERGDPEGTKKADEPYRRFREQIEQAMAEGEASIVQLIRAAAQRDWKAAAWLLERRQPDKWAGPRGRGITSSIHPDDFAAGEQSTGQQVLDDQVGPDGRPL
jgi:hypothetical protein